MLLCTVACVWHDTAHGGDLFKNVYDAACKRVVRYLSLSRSVLCACAREWACRTLRSGVTVDRASSFMFCFFSLYSSALLSRKASFASSMGWPQTLLEAPARYRPVSRSVRCALTTLGGPFSRCAASRTRYNGNNAPLSLHSPHKYVPLPISKQTFMSLAPSRVRDDAL